MRGVVAAIVDVVADAIVDAAYQALCERERCRGGKETLGHAVDRVIGLGISEFSHNVAVAKDNAVGCGALPGQPTQHSAEHAYLILFEIPLRRVSLGPLDGVLEFRSVHAHVHRGLALPFPGCGEVCSTPRLLLSLCRHIGSKDGNRQEHGCERMSG